MIRAKDSLENSSESIYKILLEFGRPAYPIRPMVMQMLLKQMYDLRDKTVTVWVDYRNINN